MECLKATFWILAAGLACLTATGSRAQAGERVLMVVASEGAGDLEALGPIIGELRDRATAKGLIEVKPTLVDVSGHEGDLGEARALGRAAFSALGSRSPQDVLGEYGTRISQALTRVSAVTDAEGRAVLWNLCALRVHLLLSMGEARSEHRTREAVMDCNLRFPDHPLLGKGWSPEVSRAFERYSADTQQVPLSVKSAPAGCELRLYGASVGTTPVIVDVTPGVQEVRLVCGGHEGVLHQVEVTSAKELVIRAKGDGAFVSDAGVAWLRYGSGGDATHAAEDAAAFAGEAGADSFLLLRGLAPGQVAIDWMRLPSTHLGRATVSLHADGAARAASINAIFDPPPAAAGELPVAKRTRKRIWKDYAVGGALIAAGAALAVYPALALARNGECVEHECKAIYNGDGAAGVVSLVGAGVLVVSGVAVLWAAPFGKRVTLSVGTRVMIRGAF